MLNEQFALLLDERRRYVFEVDRLQGFIYVQLARFAAVIDAVPIEHAVSGVAILLDLDQQITCANCMKPPCRQKHGVAGFDAASMNAVCHCSPIKRMLEFLSREPCAQPDKELGIRSRGGDIPKFC